MNKEDDFKEWIKKSEDDLIVAKASADLVKPQIEISCYHCQQCVEKMLKSFLVYHKIEFPYIHDLEKICNSCISIDPSFSIWEKQCKFLNHFISITRYPSNIEINETDMVLAIKYSENIVNFVKNILNINIL